MTRIDCPDCGGAGGFSEDTGGFTPWSEPISDWVTCETCSGRGWVFEDDPANDTDDKVRRLAYNDAHSLKAALTMPFVTVEWK